MQQAGPRYDVVICGGGLAGATLARQLKLASPRTSVLVVDKLEYPVPVAAHKVGESSVEISGFYFADVLRLREHMDEHHLPKHGLRYFWHGERDFARRPEVGLSAYTPCPSYQIDRGKFENELFALNTTAGVTIAQGASVEDIQLDPAAGHEVVYRDAGGIAHRVRARWVIDAMGRRLFLQRKLGLHREVRGVFNAAWFRVRGRLDVEDFVPNEEEEWHARVPGRQRYHSTNHLMGQGYWIWLIPLGSGNTSVGIVTEERFHDFARFGDLERAMQWIEEHDPAMRTQLTGREFMDFMSVRNFNYSTAQVFSQDRWACIGEAAAFSDPFYSPGSNLIAFENSIVTHLVNEDFAGRLSEDDIRFFNEFVISHNDWLDYNIHTAYTYFGEPLVMSMAFLWDAVVGWGVAAPQMFNGIYLHREARVKVREALGDFYALALQVKQLLIDWGQMSKGRLTFEFIDYFNVPFVNHVYARNLRPGKSVEELVADHQATLRTLEEFAQAILLVAVEDTMPSQLGRFREPVWINAWAIGLEPGRWEEDGLFRPQTKPRDLGPLLAQVKGLYRPAQSEGVPVAIDLDL
jgi:2-polyprenyl-6-methoxyphenol hydroxylase-like FAD-dependent oxidoreductase